MKATLIADIDECCIVLAGKRLYTLPDVYDENEECIVHPKVGDEVYFDPGVTFHSMTLSEFNKIVSGLAYVKGIDIKFKNP